MARVEVNNWRVTDMAGDGGEINVKIINPDTQAETVSINQGDDQVWVGVADIEAVVEALHAAGKSIEAARQ